MADEVLRIVDVEEPSVGPDESRPRSVHVSLNHLDVTGEGALIRAPADPGSDVVESATIPSAVLHPGFGCETNRMPPRSAQRLPPLRHRGETVDRGCGTHGRPTSPVPHRARPSRIAPTTC